MIFLTVGSDTPFSRLVRAFDKWATAHPQSKTVAQIGNIGEDDHVPLSVEWVKIIPADRFEKVFQAAEIVVAHAGMGSILTALSLSKPIVVLARRMHFGETRNDHQLATVERFRKHPGIFVILDEIELADAIDKALAYARSKEMTAVSNVAPTAFTDRLRRFILNGDNPS